MNNKSKFMSVKVRDFLWGLFYSLIPVIGPLGKVFSSGQFPTVEVWFSVAMKSVPVLAVYLVVHFFKNNRGELGKKDK